MTLPATPIPTLKQLCKATVTQVFTGRRWLRSDDTQAIRVYLRGSVALTAAVDLVKKTAGGAQPTVWAPDYFCNSALEHVRRLPVTIQFYPVRDTLEPDWQILEKLVSSAQGYNLFVLVHYFGFPNDTDAAKAFCTRHKMTLLEDAAHVLLPSTNVGKGDLTLFSLRKLLAAPDGAILVTSQEMGTHLSPTYTNRQTRRILGWICRRLAQQIFLWLHIPWHRFTSIGEKTAHTCLEKNVGAIDLAGCAPFALRLLHTAEQQIEQVIYIRRRNYERLAKWVHGVDRAHPLFPVLPNDVCPYMFPVLVHDGSAQIVKRLQSQGIPVSSWPDLPPEVSGNHESHKIAIQTCERLMLVPIHQSLNINQIDFIGKRLRVALHTTT